MATVKKEKESGRENEIQKEGNGRGRVKRRCLCRLQIEGRVKRRRLCRLQIEGRGRVDLRRSSGINSLLSEARAEISLSKMAAQVGSLCFPSTSTASFSFLDQNPNLSSLSSLPTLSLSSRHINVLKPISLSLRRTSRLDPIFCSTTLAPENPSLESKEDENSTTRLLAQNVPWTSTPDDIRALFEKHGTVVDVELSMHNKNRNRGLAFVEMGSAEEAAEAFAKLEAYEFEGRKLKLTYAKPKKKQPSPPVQSKPAVLYNLFVANLSFEARAKDLKEFFQSGGSNVVSAEVIFHDSPRRSSGYGFVSFKTKKEADEALSTYPGKELMGRPIRVARSKRFVKLESEMSSQSEHDEHMEANSGLDSDQSETVENL